VISICCIQHPVDEIRIAARPAQAMVVRQLPITNVGLMTWYLADARVQSCAKKFDCELIGFTNALPHQLLKMTAVKQRFTDQRFVVPLRIVIFEDEGFVPVASAIRTI